MRKTPSCFFAVLALIALLFSGQTVAAESKPPVAQDPVSAAWAQIETMMDQERVTKKSPETNEQLDALLSGLNPAQLAYEKRIEAMEKIVRAANQDVVIALMSEAAVRLAKFNERCVGISVIPEVGWHEGKFGPYYTLAAYCASRKDIAIRTDFDSRFWLAGYPLKNGKFALEVEIETASPDAKIGQRTSDLIVGQVNGGKENAPKK